MIVAQPFQRVSCPFQPTVRRATGRTWGTTNLRLLTATLAVRSEVSPESMTFAYLCPALPWSSHYQITVLPQVAFHFSNGGSPAVEFRAVAASQRMADAPAAIVDSPLHATPPAVFRHTDRLTHLSRLLEVVRQTNEVRIRPEATAARFQPVALTYQTGVPWDALTGTTGGRSEPGGQPEAASVSGPATGCFPSPSLGRPSEFFEYSSRGESQEPDGGARPGWQHQLDSVLRRAIDIRMERSTTLTRMVAAVSLQASPQHSPAGVAFGHVAPTADHRLVTFAPAALAVEPGGPGRANTATRWVAFRAAHAAQRRKRWDAQPLPPPRCVRGSESNPSAGRRRSTRLTQPSAARASSFPPILLGVQTVQHFSSALTAQPARTAYVPSLPMTVRGAAPVEARSESHASRPISHASQAQAAPAPLPHPPLPADLVQELTEQVVRSLDARALAFRERFGRF